MHIVAVCDVHATKRQGTREAVEKHYADRQSLGLLTESKSAYKCCSSYNDFRNLVARPDIDAVVIATPDHWHVLISPVPPELDYDMWLGPAPFVPYTKDRCSNVNPFFSSPFKIWPFISDYCLGWIAGWGVHPLDIALWGAEKELTGTVEVEGTGIFPADGACDTATNWNVVLTFAASGVRVNFKGIGGKSGPAPAECLSQPDQDTAAMKT